jgi:hypothetical protein
MRNEYTLLKQMTNQYGYTYYVFTHCETGKLSYFMTVVGDGFVQSEEITKEVFNNAMNKYFKEIKQ